MLCQFSLDLIKEKHSYWKLDRVCTERAGLIHDDICKVESYDPKCTSSVCFFMPHLCREDSSSSMTSFPSCPIAGSGSNKKVGASAFSKHSVTVS